MRAIGVDGAPAGWAAACLYADALDRHAASVWETELRLFETFADLAAFRAQHGPGATVAIDIPIGLLDSVALRPCDRAARRILRGRASTVFAPPARYMLSAGGDYAAVRELVEHERRRNPAARGISAQAAALVPKVAEVDTWVQAHPASEAWLFECHPELSFYAMAQGRVLPPKATAAGGTLRLRFVANAFPDSQQRLERTADWPARSVGLTDLLDAYAALYTAIACVKGEQEELGDGERDGRSVRMRISI